MKKLIVFLLLAVSACGTSGDGSAVPTAPEVRKASVVIDVRGLPAGLFGAVVLQGSTSVQPFTSSNTLAGLTPGTYTITVQPVENANARFAPSVETQQVTLAPGEIRSIVIDYAEITGRMVVGIDGLAAGSAATIDVAGPANFAAHLSQADTLRKLTPGAYTITAAPTLGASHFIPDSAVRTVRVDSARIASVVVRFQAVAQLTIQIDGLPAGVAASVDVAGLAFSKHLTAGATLSDLPLAAYVVTPSTVTVGTDVYRATVQTTTLTFAGSNSISIHYVRLLATITFRISGGPVSLGDPTSPIVTVNGPGRSFSFSRDTTVDGLPFGTYRYTVTAPNYDVFGTGGYYHSPRGAVYSSSLEGRSDLAVALDSLNTAVAVDVPLTFVTGSVTFTAPGSMSTQNASPAIDLLDPRGGHVMFVIAGDLASGLPAGTYTVNPGLSGEYQTWYLPGVFSTTATVSSDYPVAAMVIPYHLYKWPTVSFVYSGMPPGLYAPYRVNSTGYFGWWSEQFCCPDTLSHWNVAYPGTKHLEVLMPAIAADTSAAWTASPNAFDFVVQEGQTSTVTIAMRPTNILQVVATGTPIFSPSLVMRAGVMSVTYPDGSIVDFERLASVGATMVGVDMPVGTYVINANPLVLGNTTYVPDLASQTMTLSATGRTIVRITYR